MSTVPMSSPAVAVKNPDGTWSVRIQHTAEGSVTTVDFGNVLFAEVLAKAYAAGLNGTAKLDSAISKAAADVDSAAVDLSGDAKKAFAEAQVKAKALIADAAKEAEKIKAEAQALYEETKNEAEKLLDDARTEAAKIVHAVAEKIDPPAATPTPAAPVAPAAKSSLDEE